MKILVTGGAGFIGGHIVDRLIKLGYEVIIIDNLSSGKREHVNPKARFYELDITDAEDFEKVFEKEKPEIVFHVAAQPYPNESMKIPIEDAKINIIGSLILLELCKKYNIKKIIYSNSGGASYGDPESLPVNEDHPINPPTHYGVSKHTVEHYLFLYNKNYGISYTSFRYANIYGPRQDSKGEAGVIAIFIDKLLNNEPPKIFGDGTQIRDYCFVDDVVDANIWAIENGDNECYNVGTGIGTTTQEIFDKIKKITNSPLKPIHADERPGDIKKCILDSSKLQGEGWKPKILLDESLIKTLNYFKRKTSKTIPTLK